MLADTGAFSAALGARDQLIGEVITNLNAVLATVDAKSAQFSASVDQLQQLVSGLAKNRDPIAGAISPLASTTTDLTELLRNSRRPLQGILKTPGRWLPSWTTERPRSTTTSSSSARTTCACPRWAVTEHSSTSTSAR